MTDTIHPAALLQITSTTTSAHIADRIVNFLAATDAALESTIAFNKAAIFPALAAAGIACVTIEYDGGGDEGNLEAPQAFDADNQPVEFPETRITIVSLGFDNLTQSEETHALRDAIESASCTLLETTHGGWEDGEGACGLITFAVASETITLEHRSRFVDYDTSERAF